MEVYTFDKLLQGAMTSAVDDDVILDVLCLEKLETKQCVLASQRLGKMG